MSQKYIVTYTASTGAVKNITVKASNEKEALQHAKYSCFSGHNFRNVILTNEEYHSPRERGYQGRERDN